MRSRTSEASHPQTDNYQQQFRDTNSIDEIVHCETTSNPKGDITMESGLGWFHSITPSVSSDDMTSPIITSTQDNQTGQSPNSSWSEASSIVKQPNCQTEKNVVSNSGLKSNNDGVSDPFGTVPGAAQEKSFVIEKEKKQSERQKPSESLEFVFQKVSKNLRDRRVRELELKNLHCDRGGHRDRVVSGGGTRKNMTGVLDMTSDSSPLLSDKTCPSNSLVQDNLSAGKQSGSESEDRRQQTGIKNISTVLREKMAADAATDLHAKLSGFTFKPRKMKPSLHNFSGGSDVGGESHRDLDTKTESHNVSTSSLTDTEKNGKKNRQNQCRNLSEGGNRGKQGSCVSEVGDSRCEASIYSTLKVSEKDKDKSAQRKSAFRIKRSDDTEDQSQQPARVSVGDDTVINNPEPSKSHHCNSKVASSTLAKLSRYTFTCTTEPATTARNKVGKSALKTDDGECLRANSKVKRTLIDKVKGALQPLATELTQGTESPTERPSTAKRDESTHPINRSSVNMVNDGSFDYQSTVNLKKRKCFELGPPPGSTGGFKGPFSGLSLFDSLELSNDVLDTDWDQEVSKKAKV